MYCKHCGKQIPETANFCDNCGKPTSEVRPAPIQPVTVVETPAKKKKRRPLGCLIWAIVFFLVLGSCSALLSDDEPEDNRTADPAVEESTETPTSEDETEPIETVSPISLETAVSVAEGILTENFKDCTISYDETGITADISVDGAAALCMLAASGDADSKEAWDSIVENTISMAESMTGYFREVGFTDYVVSLNIMNDQNKDNILVMTMNGILVYDAADSQ